MERNRMFANESTIITFSFLCFCKTRNDARISGIITGYAYRRLETIMLYSGVVGRKRKNTKFNNPSTRIFSLENNATTNAILHPIYSLINALANFIGY
jgi:hypothetical protein